MKIWKYSEMSNKVLVDLDLADETFINPVELAGYFNEAIDEAESEINTIPRYDYFKRNAYIPVVSGNRSYAMPPGIFIHKIRQVMYQNGSIIYPIVQFKMRYEFEDQAFSEFYGKPDDYRYQFLNPAPGQWRLYFTPVSRETAIIPPRFPFPDSLDPDYGGTFPNFFAPVRIWYQRHAERMPLPTFNNVQGELRMTESLICSLAGSAFSSVNTGTNTISTVCGLTHSDGFTPYVPGAVPYVTGDILYFTPDVNGVLPAPLVAGTPYYVITTGTVGVIKLATSLQNAQLGTAITLTTTGTGVVNVQVVTTPTILGNLYVDIPQFATFIMQWVKCRCLEKDGDPRLSGATQVLQQQRKQMQDTLAEMIPDLDNEIEPDFSSYQEMS